MRKNKKRDRIFLLLLILLGLSIGFAALATTLKINGTTIINKNTWSVYWDNIDNEIGVTPTSITIDDEDENHLDNIVNFNVTLDKPGDYFEFTVDAVNAGTIDAEVLTIQKKYNDTVIPEVEDPNNRVVPVYLKYIVTYADGSAINAGDKLLKANGNTPTVRTVKVRVEYDRETVTNSDINNQQGTVSHSFSLSVQFGQATPTSPTNIAARIKEIEEDPESFRNQNQDPRNLDIGIDEEGNIINMDLWTASDQTYYDDYEDEWVIGRAYSIRMDEDENLLEEIALGHPNDYYTPATASENIVNGEMTVPMPAYIMMAGTDKFYPVTELYFTFSNHCEYTDNTITKMPKIPHTVTIFGRQAFYNVKSFESVEIPKQIVEIGDSAFDCAYNYDGENNTLTFEEGSQLRSLGYSAFDYNFIKGDLVLPSTVRTIDQWAFRYNSLSSVSFPSSATYCDYDNAKPSFDEEYVDEFFEHHPLTIIRY